MIQALQGTPQYLVDFTNRLYGPACNTGNLKTVCMNAFVSFGLSAIAGSALPVAISAAALAVTASAIYVVAIPLFKALFADQHGKMSLTARALCIFTTFALIPGLALDLRTYTLLLLYTATTDILRGRKFNVHTVPLMLAW